MATLGIDDKVWLDNSIPILISGMAGSAKSTNTHDDVIYKYYSKDEVMWCTSSNALKKAAEIKFGHDCYTIAGGPFKTVHGIFFAEIKDLLAMGIKVVVLDEALQVPFRKIIELCEKYRGAIKFIILTDTHQQLCPGCEDNLEAFIEYSKRPYVVYKELTYTYRARNDKTREAYKYYYDKCGDNCIPVSVITKNYKTIKYSQMPYNQDSFYIPHSLNIEDFLFMDKCLSTLWKDDTVILVPKGEIAKSKNPKRKSYPILSQKAANREQRRKAKRKNRNSHGYFQPYNTASPTRFQGNEVKIGHTLYYMITEKSRITYREFYTVISRLQDIDDLVIVICENIPEDEENIETFRGLPIKHSDYGHIEYEGDTLILSKKDMLKFMSEHCPDTDEIYWKKDVVYKKINGVDTKVIAARTRDAELFDPSKVKKNGTSASSVIRKDGSLQYSYIPQFYKTMDFNNCDDIHAINAVKRYTDKPRYDVDFSGAYPQIMKFCPIPIDGVMSKDESEDKVHFYKYEGDYISFDGDCKSIPIASCKDVPLADYIRDNNLGKLTYLCSVPYSIGCIPGDYTYEQYHKSDEDYRKCKHNMNYGTWRHHYLELSETNDCYLINESNIYEPIMIAIESYQLYYMSILKDALNGSYIKVDAVFFNYEPDNATYDLIRRTLPDWCEYKVEYLPEGKTRKDDKIVIHRKGEVRKTKAQIKSEYDKQRRANMTDEQKAKEAERKREARAKKKLANQEG